MARIRNLPYYAYLRYRIHRLQAQIDANNRLTTHLSTQRGIDEYAYRITLNNTQFNASRDFATWARQASGCRAARFKTIISVIPRGANVKLKTELHNPLENRNSNIQLQLVSFFGVGVGVEAWQI
ncbi:uncharacterized protein H6S33_010909 [Morchella sextelata]|uniref:uncharacterized protein n=1 Tax=Morchella sextelata TaxID=1174677 RepID=UPI001D05B5AE|nr:uncharacterized protein H6S33_010909 [Morchella sextelata]KAH0611644.1 hypothetical protein H6S33_010909 [Morchella sextelata]